MPDAPVILFDGDCNLCHGGMRFIAKRDARKIFQFAPLQSSTGRAMLRAHDLPTDRLDTMVLIEDDTASQRSEAAIRIARHLKSPWPLLGRLFSLLPRFLREALYRLVARTRYRLAGRRNGACPKMPEELAERMLN